MNDKNSNMKKIIGIVLVLVMLSIAAVVFVTSMSHIMWDYESRSEAIVRINALQQERARYYAQIEKLENERDKTETGGAAVFLCFNYADRNLYEVIFPTVTYHEFRGIFTFTSGQLPVAAESTDKGITVGEYKEMLAADWEGAIKYSPEADLAAMKTGFEALEVPFPEIVVFEEGEYSSDLVEELKGLGINICICDSSEDDGMMKIASEPIMYNPSVVKLRTNRMMNSGTPLVVTTGHVRRYVDDKETDCDLEKYEEMMRWMKIMQHQGGLRLQNTYDTDTVMEMLNFSIEQANQSQAEIVRLYGLIDEIDAEILSISEGMGE